MTELLRRAEANALLLTDLLPVDQIRIPLRSSTRDEVLRELVDLATVGMGAETRDDVLRAVLDRESKMSTGIGLGVAIPHGRSTMLTELRVIAARSASPIDVQALDGEPARLFFLLVGPESDASSHIKALSRVSRLVRRDEIRQRLIDAPDAATFLAILQEAEDQG